MNDQQAAAIKFVRCHYIKQGPMNRLTAIIVRFDSFLDRMLVWNKRRSMKKIYVAKDFPYWSCQKNEQIETDTQSSKQDPTVREKHFHEKLHNIIFSPLVCFSMANFSQ